MNHTVRLNAYRIVSDAVDRGVQRGMERAHKHEDAPSRDTMEDAIAASVIEELSYVLMLDEPAGGDS